MESYECLTLIMIGYNMKIIFIQLTLAKHYTH